MIINSKVLKLSFDTFAGEKLALLFSKEDIDLVSLNEDGNVCQHIIGVRLENPPTSVEIVGAQDRSVLAETEWMIK